MFPTNDGLDYGDKLTAAKRKNRKDVFLTDIFDKLVETVLISLNISPKHLHRALGRFLFHSAPWRDLSVGLKPKFPNVNQVGTE